MYVVYQEPPEYPCTNAMTLGGVEMRNGAEASGLKTAGITKARNLVMQMRNSNLDFIQIHYRQTSVLLGCS